MIADVLRRPETEVEEARAKINLALHVTGRREDGYHLLDSLVVFAREADSLSFHAADRFSFEVEGPFGHSLAAEGENLVERALEALEAVFPGRLKPARIVLEKALPVASGIGGGSADAAAALRALLRWSGLVLADADLRRIALRLGADVPVCLRGTACRMGGIGEEIVPLHGFPPLPAVLVNPGLAVSTADVFRSLGLRPGTDGRSGLPRLPRGGEGAEAWIRWLVRCRNDLEPAATALAPLIRDVLGRLRDAFGCDLARMSGSGATCFGLFESDAAARRCADALAARHSGWWVRATVLG